MNKTSIEWVRDPVLKSPDLDPLLASSYELGETRNFITGCLNHVNGMCKGGNFPCYAYRLADTRLRERYLANTHVSLLDIKDEFRDYEISRRKMYPFYPRFWPERIAKFFRRYEKPLGIFVCDMADLFGIGIPEEWQRMVFTTIKAFPQHRFYLLTKQPQNLAKFSPFPDNCFVGVTATDYWWYVDGCNYLSRTEASIKYISFEPLLLWDKKPSYFFKSSGISWVIIGAQTKPTVYPKIEWVREIVEAADKAGVKVFLKNNLKPLLMSQGAQQNIFWADLRDKRGFEPLYCELRQEIPHG